MKRNMLDVITVSFVLLIGINACKTQPHLVTVSGTVSAANWSSFITGNPSIMVSDGNQSFTTLVPITGSSGSGIYNYSIPWVPTGIYSVKIYIFTSLSGPTGATYSVNGGAYMPVISESYTGSSSPYCYSAEIDDVAINADMRIDLILPLLVL